MSATKVIIRDEPARERTILYNDMPRRLAFPRTCTAQWSLPYNLDLQLRYPGLDANGCHPMISVFALDAPLSDPEQPVFFHPFSLLVLDENAGVVSTEVGSHLGPHGAACLGGRAVEMIVKGACSRDVFWNSNSSKLPRPWPDPGDLRRMSTLAEAVSASTFNPSYGDSWMTPEKVTLVGPWGEREIAR